MPWQTPETAGVETKTLYDDSEFAESTRLERWAPGSNAGEQSAGEGIEILIMEGSLQDEHGTYSRGWWLRLPAGASHTPYSPGGCVLYCKSGALPGLDSG
jgi:anti-sigma factor ChrR (cupin superfamily)